jgi:NAD(P)-dependent dehydrogenase (short-subunit alcohol dehydrogenase family)
MITSRRDSDLEMLEGKAAVIYGAGGVGSVVARAFAQHGARVFLAGRTLEKVESLAQEISKAGGKAEIAKVDALDEKAVEAHLKEVVGRAGHLDVSFNLTSAGVGIGRTLVSLTEEQFARASSTVLRANFVTATAAARIMQAQGRGVILGLTASNARIPLPNQGGFSVMGAAMEALFRQLALEAGPQGVRVVCLRTGGTPDNPNVGEAYAEIARVQGTTTEQVQKEFAQKIALKRLPLLSEVANAAVIMASDYASAITATSVDVSAGDIVD